MRVCVVTVHLTTHTLQGNGSSTQMYLEKFLKTIETYFYPANFGRWMGKLKELLVKLPYHFIIRLHVYVNINVFFPSLTSPLSLSFIQLLYS